MITKEDFEILHWVEFMNYNDPKKLSQQMGLSEKEAEIKMKELEKNELIIRECRFGKLYGYKLTEKGLKIWNAKRYLNWKLGLGY
ncbi:hypothetical protein J4405_03280 [Candidatus Woesearchaeota archaeon]|nr:hypothetical protein [Candidatus Woesearchaeota archaeon]